MARNAEGEVSLVAGEAVRDAARLAERGDGGALRVGRLLAGLRMNSDSRHGESARFARFLGAGRAFAALGGDIFIFRRLALYDGPFDAVVAAALTGAPAGQIRRAMASASSRGLIRAEQGAGGGGVDRSYRFVRVSDRSRLASALLDSERRATCRDIARYLGQKFSAGAGQPEPASRAAARIARHATAGGDDELALAWWRRAAEYASREARPGEALRHLNEARRIISRAPRSASADEHFDVLWSSATTLGAIRGNADPDVLSLYRDCLSLLSHRIPDARQAKFDVLFGLQTSHLVRGEIGEAQAIGRQLLGSADEVADDAMGCIAHRLAGLTLFLAGEPTKAIGHYRRSLSLYEAGRHEGLRHRYASDQKATALAGLAWAEAVAGRAHEAVRTAADAEASARQTRHPHTIAHVASVLAARAQMVGQPDEAAAFAQLAHDVAEANGLAYWAAWSGVILGWFETQTRPAAGMARIEKCMADYLATGALQAMPFILLLKADAEIASGNLVRAAVTLARAERFTRPRAMAVWRSEVLRAAARVAMTVQSRTTAAGLARKAYSIAAAQDADLFCGQAVAEIAAIAGGSRGDIGRLIDAVKQSLV
jgi:tetratricopeptide (TPR) repeat protein